MVRLKALRRVVNEGIEGIVDTAVRQDAFWHLYSVAQQAAMLALKRGIDVELAMMAGLLHDYFSFLHWEEESFRNQHAHLGAPLVRELLEGLGVTQPEETERIVQAVHHHSEKGQVTEPLGELLKDADVLSHFLHDTGAPIIPGEEARLEAVLQELSIYDALVKRR